MSTCKVDKKTLEPKQGQSDWLDLANYPTDKTLYLHPSKLGSSAQSATGGATIQQSLVAIEVSPDKETAVRLPVSYANTRDHHYPTSFDYRYARVVRLPNGPGAADSSDVGWTLTACAADEQEQASGSSDKPALAAIDAVAKRIEALAKEIDGLRR